MTSLVHAIELAESLPAPSKLIQPLIMHGHGADGPLGHFRGFGGALGRRFLPVSVIVDMIPEKAGCFGGFKLFRKQQQFILFMLFF